MRKFFGKKSESSLNFNLTFSTYSPDTMEILQENSTSNSLVSYFNTFQNGFLSRKTENDPSSASKPELDLLDLSIFKEITLYSDMSF
jgi:hypothetical protein